MVEYLEKDLISNLKEAKSVSIAVALIKEYGLNIIEENIPENCERKYIVGIHLPTPPDILRKLLALQNDTPDKVNTRIYFKENYHPKVYLIEKTSGDFIVFVGSANATRGGFNHNIEMSVSITDQSQCLSYKYWFNDLFLKSEKYDADYIDKYEVAYLKNKALASTQKSNVESIVQSELPTAATLPPIKEEQFFRQSDFNAFAPELHMQRSADAVKLRAKVKERLIELSDMIISKFSEYGIVDLHLPYRRNLYVSQHFHSSRSPGSKDAIWLNFGKSKSELNKYHKPYHSITNHIRLQVILRNNKTEAFVGIWLYLSKPHRSDFDKDRLVKGLENNDYEERLFEYVVSLGGSYWITRHNECLNILAIKDSKQLADFLRKDINSSEIVIGRNYDPNDSDVSEKNIAETILIEFSKLYKIYSLIKAPAPETT